MKAMRGLRSIIRLIVVAGVFALTVGGKGPGCGGGGSQPSPPSDACPDGTKRCGSGCIFTTFICCGSGTNGASMCNPVTASQGVADGMCPAAAGNCTSGSSSAMSQFCCNPSGGIGSDDCAPPKHFCASKLSPATVCIDTPCCPPGREVEFGCADGGTPEDAAGPDSAVGVTTYDGMYSGTYNATDGSLPPASGPISFTVSNGVVIDDPDGGTVDANGNIRLGLRDRLNTLFYATGHISLTASFTIHGATTNPNDHEVWDANVQKR